MGLAAGKIWGRGAAALGLAVFWAGGVWTLNQPMPADTDFTLRLVQPNAEQSLKWDAAQAQVFYDRLIRATSAGGGAPVLRIAIRVIQASGTPPIWAIAQDGGRAIS
jgi:apolipoprotein N-acyltransferase